MCGFQCPNYDNFDFPKIHESLLGRIDIQGDIGVFVFRVSGLDPVVDYQRFLVPMRNVKKMAGINVDKMSLKELVDLEAKVKKAIASARDRERSDLKKKMADLAETHGFSVSELFGAPRGKSAGRTKSVGVAKYANPENRADTWTGRGRKPNWLVERLRKGAKLNDFAI